jgi:NitT/TauT family transport system permease protein
MATADVDNFEDTHARTDGKEESDPKHPRLRLRPSNRRIAILVAQIGTILVAIVAWQHVGSSHSGRMLYSSPTDVWASLRTTYTQASFWQDVRVTVTEALFGFLLGVGLGIMIACLLYTVPLLKVVTAPFINGLSAVPKIALAPLFLVWFGFTSSSKIAFVTSITFFIVFWNVATGLEAIDRVYIQHTRLLGAGTYWRIRDVYAPAMVGWVMTSIRLCAAWSLLSAILAEYLGAYNGLGHRIAVAQQLYQQNIVISGIITVALLAMVVDWLLARVQGRFSRWRLT